MDYPFRALGPVAFEHLVQALVVARHKNVEVFGRGPDGGRDAAILDYQRAETPPSPPRLVRALVQAKWVDVSDREPGRGWRAFSSAASAELGRWREIERTRALLKAKNEEREDRRPRDEVTPKRTKKFTAKPELSRSPWMHDDEDDESSEPINLELPTYDHLIFVTNASLSAVSERGGFDRFMESVPELIQGTPFSGVEVWHYANLCALVDGHEGIRNLYFSGLMGGDVRAWLESREIENRQRVVNEVYAYTLAEFRHDRLMEPGHLGELENNRYKLSEVFFDLPADNFDWNGLEPRKSLTKHLVSQLDSIGRPSIVGDSRRRFVVVGGPGQGKTTVSRFIGQLYRAAIVSTSTNVGAERDIAELSREIMSCAQRSKVKSPVLRRWPLRVVLSDYARRFTSSDSSTANALWSGPPLLEYLEERINSVAQVPINRSELLKLMVDWPVLLILDGMDETPTALRGALVEAIRQFEDSARHNDIDLAILITTRPQAVGTDFDQSRYQHLRVFALGPEAAGDYGAQLMKLRFSNEVDRYNTSLERLKSAIEDPNTSTLFKTPLQVAILVLLLETRIRLPESRFRLFDAYFRTIYHREENKPTDLAVLLQRYRDTIETVHRRIALYLHLRADDRKGAAARVTTNELEHVVRHLLAEAGNATTLDQRVGQLMEAIKDRLVFLIADVEGKWGFEVQSIQEYLIALALLDDDLRSAEPDSVDTPREILGLTATATRWRNVWLLTAGASYQRSRQARYRIMNILNSLDFRDVLTQVSHPAAALAIDMIDDRIAHQAPEDLKALLGIVVNAGAAFPAQKSRALVAALVELQNDFEVSPTILGLLRGVEPSTAPSWFHQACEQLAEGGNLEAQARELLSRIGRPAAGVRSGTHPLETLAIIETAASHATGLGDSEEAVLTEIRQIGYSRLGVSDQANHSVGVEATYRRLATLFEDREFVVSFASLLDLTFSGSRQIPARVLELITRVQSLEDRTPEVWPLVREYVLLEQ